MTRIIFPALCCVALAGQPLGAIAQTPPAQTAQAGAVLRADAPDSHVVRAGDTLWSIAGRFLQEPWRWPDVWRMNQEQIRNPHLIYPGQVIVLDRSGPYLTLARPLGDPPLQKLGPREYHEQASLPISSIPQQIIEPFLIRPRVSESREIEGAATLVATQEKQAIVATGDMIYARDVEPGVPNWQIYRRTLPVIDPVTREVLGFEADYLGMARVIDGERDGITTLRITDALEQIAAGDRLVAAERPKLVNYVPAAPGEDIAGHVVDLKGDLATGGKGVVVSLNLGEFDGLKVGHVLALHRDPGTVRYKAEGDNEAIRLPSRRSGLLFVFRVFDRVAYALVMESDGPVLPGDVVRSPGYRD